VNLSGQKQEIDRRKWDRLPLAIPIFVRSKDGNDKELLEFATALNVSAGGALVAVRRALPLSSQVLLEIPSAPVVSGSNLPKASRNLQARIMWAKHAEGYQLAGVKFSHALLSGPPGLSSKRRKAISPM
jgi:c-di-GMP-binding flagellar brake protein YcgR